MKDLITKLVSNPEGVVAAVLAAFVLISAILTGVEKFLLSAAGLLDTFKDKTATDVDNKASDAIKKAAGVLSTILGYAAKVVNWINGFKAPNPPTSPNTPTPAPASSESSETKPAA